MKNKIYVCVFIFLLTACDDKPKQATTVPEAQVESKLEIAPDVTPKSDEQIIPEVVDVNLISSTYPAEIIKFIDVRQEGCPKNRKHKVEDLVKSVNLVGDEKPEFILEPDSIHCEEYASVSGNGGREITVFATLKDGLTKQVFKNAMFDYKLKSSGFKQELWLEVGGGYCGQDMSQISRAEAIICQRLVEWDEKAQEFKLGKMVLAPDSNESAGQTTS